MIRRLVLIVWALAAHVGGLVPAEPIEAAAPCGGGFCCSLCSPIDAGCSGCKAEPASGCNGEASFDCPAGTCYNGEGACGNPGEPWTAGCCD
jgi:hypothetical protein